MGRLFGTDGVRGVANSELDALLAFKIGAAAAYALTQESAHGRKAKLLIGKEDGFRPCTPWGVMLLLEKSGIDPAGKHAVVIGRSNIVGKPMAALLMQKAKGANATVTVVHSGTPDIARFTRDADILIAAIGKPEFVRGDMIKPGAAVIDVGINRTPNPAGGRDRLVGDVKFDEAVEVAGAVTPVPGGVGPMTIAVLMSNAVTACERRK